MDGFIRILEKTSSELICSLVKILMRFAWFSHIPIFLIRLGKFVWFWWLVITFQLLISQQTLYTLSKTLCSQNFFPILSKSRYPWKIFTLYSCLIIFLYFFKILFIIKIPLKSAQDHYILENFHSWLLNLSSFSKYYNLSKNSFVLVVILGIL